MFRNYLKISFRHLLRHRQYSFINILGLAVGITCCLLIMLFVRSEFSYDKFHTKSDRIYRVWAKEKSTEHDDIIDVLTPYSMASVMQSNFPQIEATCRVLNINGLISKGDKSFNEDLRFVDTSFFKIFDFKLVQGDQHNPFPQQRTVLLTEASAKKYFGDINPIGKTLSIQWNKEKVPFIVSGIVKQAPQESSIQYKILVPYSNADDLFSENARRSWYSVSCETYAMLKQGVNPETLMSQFPSMVAQYLGSDYIPGSFIINLQPITKIHLDNSLPAGIEPISSPKYSYILMSIGLLILLVAAINFITLSVGRSNTRAMEVGVRKVLGAEKKQLIGQFWGEGLLLTLISVLLAIGLAALLLKPFNTLTQRNLRLEVDGFFIGYAIALVFLIGLIIGIYPALLLSRFNPVSVLKGKTTSGGGSGVFRKAMITAQFVASIALIVCTIVIGKQLSYLRGKDLGYSKEKIVVVSTNSPRAKGMELGELYRTELIKQPQVAAVSVSLLSMTETPWIAMGYYDDQKTYRNIQFNAVDPYFVGTMGMKIVKGRDFIPGNQLDVTSSMIVNEALAKEYGWDDPIGKKLPGRMEQQIIGVVKDFNYQSLHTKIEPLAMVIKPDSFFRRVENINISAPAQPRITVRLRSGDLSSQVAMLKDTWNEIAPGQEFDFHFLDETIAAQYGEEQRTGKIANMASLLSIFIASMGLFGLATLTVARRTKEIGIRKVLGASIKNILGLISGEFVTLIVIAALVAFPLGWWLMNRWLEDFAYRVSIAWWIFPVAGIFALGIALLTVGLQSFRAASAKPVNSLRDQ